MPNSTDVRGNCATRRCALYDSNVVLRSVMQCTIVRAREDQSDQVQISSQSYIFVSHVLINFGSTYVGAAVSGAHTHDKHCCKP